MKGDKKMKKIILLVLSITLITSTFSACGDTPATDSSSESATSKVVAITTTTTTSEKKSETSSLSTETESVAETTPSVSETQSKIETTVEPVNEKKLNLDLLSDIGLTYEEIGKIHGNLKEVFKLPSGNFCYTFMQGQIGYIWGFDKVYKVEGSSENILLPNTDEKCQSILIFESKDFFLGLNSSVSSYELEKLYDVTHISSGYNAHDQCYFSSFERAGMYFYVETEETGIIIPSSSVQISLISDWD